MQPTTEKIVDINKYRQPEREQKPPALPQTSPNPIVREMAYHLMMAVQFAKKLL